MEIQLKDGTIRILGIIDLSKFIWEMLLNKPNKSQNFRSLAVNMGEEGFIIFTEHCVKQLKWTKEKRIEKLKKEIKKLEIELND